MNCLDFRRDALAQPLRVPEDALAHARDCASCRDFLEHQRQLDAELFEVLSVPAPDGLADRILFARGSHSRGRRWFAAAAASLVLAAGAAIVGAPMFAGDALAREAIAHVRHEPQSFTLVSRHPPGLLSAELAAQGLRLAASVGEVTYAVFCPMASGKARHVVVATNQGPVTLFLLPDDGTRRRRSVVDAGGFTAITLPAARGAIAIVAADPRQALAIERALVAA